MWASVQTNNAKLVRPDSRFHRAIPVGASDLSSAKAYGGSSSAKTSGTADTTVIDDDDCVYPGRNSSGGRGKIMARGGRAGVVTPANDGAEMMGEEDLEMQRLKNGVVVDRTYSVRSD